ncbi:hypothetical protein D1872_51680 [compost metagenome]
MFVLKDLNNKKYYKNPSFRSWELVDSSDQATTFETMKEAMEMKDTVNHAISLTFWDYDDIVPSATVEEVSE